MKTGAEYRESLKTMKTVIYANGEKIDDVTEHPLTKPHVNSVAVTYDLAHDPEFEDLMTVKSHLTGKKINRFTHVHHSIDDLIKKVKMLRMISQQTGTCYQRCVGFDAMNATYMTTYEIDKELGTNYHERFKKFLEYVQENDLMVAGAMTDVKGDRSKRPSQQADPDLFVHVVSENEEGIVIRGAKTHMTGMVNSHEMIIMPTMALKEQDKDYAICCALPVDAEGVIHMFGRQTNDMRKYCEYDQGNAAYGMVGGECLTILEDVFVPWERVFLFREYQYAGALVERFASYHRQNYGGCKVGVSDVLIGATASLVKYSGVEKASHVQDKIAEMTHLANTMYSCSIACSSEGAQTPCGSYYVNTALANSGKYNVTKFIYEIGRLSQDLAGGLIATLPFEAEYRNPELGHYIEKYYKGVESVPTEERLRMARLVENMTGGTALVESMHGAGSPQAMKVMLVREANLEHKMKLARKLAGIKEV
ncbi:MAG: 4-hydroxyphenylacetate 3-hydroxylase family protein [Peptostreptococcales bacterium]